MKIDPWIRRSHKKNKILFRLWMRGYTQAELRQNEGNREGPSILR